MWTVSSAHKLEIPAFTLEQVIQCGRTEPARGDWHCRRGCRYNKWYKDIQLKWRAKAMLSNLFYCKTMQPVAMSDKILKCDKRNSYRVSISMMLLKLFVYYYRQEEITCHLGKRGERSFCLRSVHSQCKEGFNFSYNTGL